MQPHLPKKSTERGPRARNNKKCGKNPAEVGTRTPLNKQDTSYWDNFLDIRFPIAFNQTGICDWKCCFQWLNPSPDSSQNPFVGNTAHVRYCSGNYKQRDPADCR